MLLSATLEMIDSLFNRIGLGSITLTGIATVAPEVEVIAEVVAEATIQNWTLAALVISAIGGCLFIIEKVFMIYIRYKQSKKIHDKKPPGEGGNS